MFTKIDMIKKIILFITVTFFISCAEDESLIQNNKKTVEISSFLIEENNVSEVKTKTNLKIRGYSSVSFKNHGVIVLYNNSLVQKIEQGVLSKNSFETNIKSGLVKGNNYTVLPYVVVENKFIYGDTINFKSNIDIKIKVKNIRPLNGFIYDTISVIGENFCSSNMSNSTKFLLNNNYQNVIFESDSLIKAIITPNINVSKSAITVRNCGVDTIISNRFKINPPLLDSLSYAETYVGENSFAYGENFHSQISNIWINDIEAPLNKQRLDIDKLEFTIPEGLPAGLLNFKVKVLDTIIEKENYFKSTSPIITSIDKRDTGFLDTLNIKGNYLKQKNTETKVFVGGKEQKILKISSEEIQIVINAYFSSNESKLLLKTGSFELEETLNMLPPEIISFDKNSYHLDDDIVILKTKYFIAGSSSNIYIGGVTLNPNSYSFNDVDEYGNITLSMFDWLEARSLRYPKFVFSEIGKLNVELKTQFGTSEKYINIFPPKIESIENSLINVGGSIKLTGLDFGYSRVSSIYIDDELISNPGISTYSIYNKKIQFEVPETIRSGNHKLKVKTGGQFSNEISFKTKEITVVGFTTKSGVRELDVFTINGNNLEYKNNYNINVNGIRSNIISSSNTHVQFTLPYNTALESNMPVTLEYGVQVIDVGVINGIEPYSKLNNYEVPSDYYRNSSYFEFKGELYFLNENGIFFFDKNSEHWVTYESDTPLSGYSDVNGKNYISEVGNKIYVSYGRSFYPYDMVEKKWETPIEIDLEENHRILYGIVTSSNYIYIMEGLSLSGITTFVKYDIINNTKQTLTQPQSIPGSSGLGDVLYYSGGKVYLDTLKDSINVYDISTDTWEYIGFPKAYKYFYDNNLYIYNNILYFSGGQGNTGLEYNLYAYDLNTKVWTEKTPLLLKLGKHVVWGSGDFLYFGLGNQTYTSYDNYDMLKYDINKDIR